MTDTDTDLLLWFDLETTGLDETTDEILEVGWGLTDTKLNWVVEPRPYLIQHNITHGTVDAWVEINGTRVDPYVAKMHHKSGLWQDYETSHLMALNEAEATLVNVIDSLTKNKVTMAGSGVAQFDLRWVGHHMPRLRERLNYYTIDMGIFERVEWMLRGGGIRSSRNNAAHRSVDDIDHAYRLAIRYRELFLVGADFDRANP